jgi:hypothetical protein
MKALATLLLMLAALPARAAPPACPFAGQTPMLVVRLYFGQSIQGHGVVSRRAWHDFVADTLTPALPAGFTVYHATGQYIDQQTGAIGHEATEVVEVAAADTTAFRQRIAAVAEAYRRRFLQGAVGLVSSTACGVF